MKKSIVLVTLLCLTLLSSCSVPNSQANETQAESKTAALTSETSADNNTSAESDLPFAPYKSYTFEENVEDVLNDNPIDKSFLAEASKQFTSVDNAEFIRKYIQIWNAELNYTLKNLRSILKGSALKTLNNSQSAWQKFFDSNYNLGGEISLATVGQGSGIPILNGYKGIALIRERTLELKEYYAMATDDFPFKFH